MNTTVLMSIAFGLITVTLILVLVKIFKDKKMDEPEKKLLQDIIIESFNEVIEVSTLKTEQELKDYCVMLVMKKLKDNNIQGINEKTVINTLELLLKLNAKLNEKLEKKIK